MAKVLSLGEILLRLSPPQYQTLTQANQLDCQFGGSELNVLATLAQLGHDVSLISVIPDNDLGRMTEQFLFSKQIGQEFIIKKGDRLGLYFYQKGFSIRSSRVTYDRKYSAFWESRLTDFDFEAVFNDVDWFHVSGITPALTEELYSITEFLMKKAQSLGVKVSFDLNFRASLWDSFQQARQKLSSLIRFANVCVGIEPIVLEGESKDLKDELGLARPYCDEKLLLHIVKEIANKYQLESIAFTQRESTHTNEYQLKAFLFQNGTLYKTEKTGIQVLDRVGTGDAFTAGLIHGLLSEGQPQLALKTAMACFKFKHTIEGDINVVTNHDIEQLLYSDSHEIKR
ncbi:PfkB family carbohydrate kinase [Streptococcus porcinus]|uniref:sugar kinase n=1 Tax=Streptococcus porcinus TaxID=1340 RepID=UPI0019622584|nr:sugar kinase [Streptococcus porcinus]